MGSAPSHSRSTISCGSRREELCNTESEEGTGDVWREQLLGEVGKDPLGVTRDFPRTPVYVSTATRNNYIDLLHEKGDQIHVVPLGNSETECARMVERNRRVQNSLELLMELCGEDTSTMTAVWLKEESVGATDVSMLLRSVFVQSGMMQVEREGTSRDLVENYRGSGSPSSPSTEKPNYSTFSTPLCVPVQYTVDSKALRLMQYMVQSVAFFSVRWMTDLLRFTWCKHMQDVLWTVHVYQGKTECSDAENGEEDKLIIVQHRHIIRHYVKKNQLRITPRFEVEWTCSICIDPRKILQCDSIQPKIGDGAEVRRIDTKVLAARVESPKQTLCLASDIWKKRCRELSAYLRKRLRVELNEVSKLNAYSTY